MRNIARLLSRLYYGTSAGIGAIHGRSLTSAYTLDRKEKLLTVDDYDDSVDFPWIRELVIANFQKGITVAKDTPATEPMRRASEFIKGIGENLDTYQGRDLVLLSYDISQRPMRGEDKTFVSMKVREVDGDEIAEVHAWSQPLAEKLKDIPVNAMPCLVKFVKVSSAGGFKLWNVE